jgi:transglutaminase-like putative cysteine protease
MNYEITHTTTYEYLEPVSLSHHVLRLRPRDCAGQNRFDFEIALDPSPTSILWHTDYFGNSVALATVEHPHTQLEIRAASKVRKTGKPRLAGVDPAETLTWERVRDLSRGHQIGPALEASEFLFDSPLITAGEQFFQYGKVSFTKDRPVLEAVLDLTRRIHQEFNFDPEATTPATPVDTVLNRKRGVCQDFAHVQIACLRAMGVPARYVSGYLETLPPPGREKLVGADASHAWVSFYCPGLGWIEVDPTNNLAVSDQHIILGWGRDFSDVSPVRGVVLGTGPHSVTVGVDVQALEAD